jgi:hypothetical protein
VLHGIPVKLIACLFPDATTKPTPTPITSVDELALCEIQAHPSEPTVTRAGSAQFEMLMKALSRPGEPPSGAACPAYADAPWAVFAKTPTGNFRVLIPTDGCGHYFPDLKAALHQGR